ncbi:hypothetical protein NA57DRAFT_39354 [Rhizodiscina lignyota]|uniref:C2 domain-containing protein n=1 Tax=Rhizodiscina lignyota TaxID=1504668 RepID=A0A9P4M689_9PEZI|nr:hypothetical protein NA57DRAFT_39354 [Rhizodiscina lignyota]
MASESENADAVPAPSGPPAEEPQTNGNAEKRDMEGTTREEPPNSPPQDEKPKDDQPAGGFDQTPLPRAPPGYTIQITFHRATNLPMADVNSLSSDPYIIAQLYTDLPTRHKEDPPLQLRTPTIRKSTDPEWNTDWIIANVPASGFKLKARIYDEDPATHDDRLGNAHIVVPSLSENWRGLENEGYKVKKRSGSKRAYFVRIFAACIGTAKHMNGFLYVSIKLLGRTQDDQGGRVYTAGPNWFVRHYSPMLGRFVGMRDADNEQTPDSATEQKRVQKYNFQANQMQLTGPIPWQMYHRYVEFKPFVKGMFTAKGIRGFLLSKTLHHQHARVYTYDRNSIYGVLPSHSLDMTRQFLDLVHYDKGGRIFTYVLTLDALFRFTETGKEFGIDLLSKHTMHSDVSIYIAFSGEFFIRRLKHKHATSQDVDDDEVPTHPPEDIPNGPPGDEPPNDPRYFELVIDNDSGTYRPNAKLLPLLKEFMSANFPGLKIVTLDCQADAEKMGKMKDEQRERKKKEGDHIVFTQANQSDSSISSSEEEALDDLEAEGEQNNGLLKTVKRDASARKDLKKEKFKGMAKGRDQPDAGGGATVTATDDATGGPSTSTGAA